MTRFEGPELLREDPGRSCFEAQDLQAIDFPEALLEAVQELPCEDLQDEVGK